MQKYHDEPKQYKGYLKSALAAITANIDADAGVPSDACVGLYVATAGSGGPIDGRRLDIPPPQVAQRAKPDNRTRTSGSVGGQGQRRHWSTRPLHVRVADAFERTAGEEPEKRASDLAHHLYQAGTAADVEKTVRYLEHAP